MNKFESGDKNIRDIIEGPPRMETPKAEEFISQENATENIMTQTKKSVAISKDNAHKVALSLLNNPIFVKKLKEMISEKLVRKQHFTRLDQLLEKSSDKDYYKIYGLTEEHIADIKEGNFLDFNFVKDGPDMAITFTKNKGDKGIRPIDDVFLAEMLNQFFFIHPELNQDEKEYISRR